VGRNAHTNKIALRTISQFRSPEDPLILLRPTKRSHSGLPGGQPCLRRRL
jgi:hypothetical protein